MASLAFRRRLALLEAQHAAEVEREAQAGAALEFEKMAAALDQATASAKGRIAADDLFKSREETLSDRRTMVERDPTFAAELDHVKAKLAN